MPFFCTKYRNPRFSLCTRLPAVRKVPFRKTFPTTTTTTTTKKKKKKEMKRKKKKNRRKKKKKNQKKKKKKKITKSDAQTR